MSETKASSSGSDALAAESRARIIPLDRDLADRATQPFGASAARKCYVIFDKGPPPVLVEVDCGDIVIVDDKMKLA